MVMAKLKIGGAWSGVLEVELDEWTVTMLREEVAKRSGCGGLHLVNLIFAGRVLKDGDGTEKLSQLGVKNNAKILASRVSPDQGQSLLAEEERCKRLARLKRAATSLAKRHADGTLPVEDFNLELENQSGERVQLGSETDQRAIMMGLMLHANAKRLIRLQKYKDALEVLVMGEEAFSLCDPKLIEMVDNVPILQIDLVWCYFMLRDVSLLSEAGIRLAKAREGIQRAHGKEASRVRLLQGGRYPELALHLRLELLEGVVAYHNGHLDKSRQALTSAQFKYFQLEVADEALSLLMSMGYRERESKRALRMNNQNVESAIDFLVEERARKAKKREEDIRHRDEITEQKRYGRTPNGKPVGLQKLNQLVSIGYEKALAAESLRRNENDTQKALDDLTNPETNSAIQVEIESKKKTQRQAADAAIEELMSLGFPSATVAAAVRMFGTQDAALNHLLALPNENAVSILNYGGSDWRDMSARNGEGPSDHSAVDERDVEMEDDRLTVEERDVEMEDELTTELVQGDAFSDYDIEAKREGEAINEYLALLNSEPASCERVPSSR